MAPEGRLKPRKAAAAHKRAPKGNTARHARTATGTRHPTRQLRDSLENTHQGLQAFRASLARSGLADAVEGYQALQRTLQAQHGWSVQNDRIELAHAWRRVASEAEAIAALLEPYVSLMKVIAELDGVHDVVASRNAPRAPSSKHERELAESLLSSCRVSRRRLQGRDTQLCELAERLARHGRLEARGWGHGRTYGSTAAQRRELEERLSQLLQPADSSPADP